MLPGRSPASGRDESGVLMMFVLMAILMIAAVTLTVIELIRADVAGGLRELQAEQVFNIAQAGVHYAIGKLQLSGGNSYAGETATITSGGTTLGTATIVVNCIDTGAPPCTGNYSRYRRIVSTGALPASGPSRTIVAIVQATQGGTPGICGYTSGVSHGGTNVIYSDVGSNTGISVSAGDLIRADPNTPPAFPGLAVAQGSITCASSCASQVQGGIFPGQSSAVCPALTQPTFSPGSTSLSVTPVGFTIDPATTGTSWGDVSVASGTCSGPTPFTDLQIQADASNPNTTTVVQINTLNMGACSRVVILGVGKVELRIGKAAHNSLQVNSNARFAVLPSDTLSTPAPVPPSRFTVWDNSIGSAGATTAVQFLSPQIVSATLFVPNGRMYASNVTNMYGAVWADWVAFQSGNTFTSDISGLPASVVVPFSNFNYLRSWKDQ